MPGEVSEHTKRQVRDRRTMTSCDGLRVCADVESVFTLLVAPSQKQSVSVGGDVLLQARI